MDVVMEPMETDEVTDDAAETDELYESYESLEMFDKLELVTFPVCDRSDCHAWQDGKCMALEDNDFGSRPCPFYKNRDVNRKEQEKCMMHLIKTGRKDLLKKYKRVNDYLSMSNMPDAFADRVADELEQYSRDVLQELLAGELSNGPDSVDVSGASSASESEESDWDD